MSTITTINATDKPRLSREVINTNFANLNASKAEIADVVLLAGSYANPTWITSLSWAKITGTPPTYAPSAHTHPFTEITGTIANAQVPQSAVTQHQAALALTATQITSGSLALARGGTGADLSATGGTGFVLKQTAAGAAVSVAALVAADIPSLDASKITTGTFADARIAASNVTQHQAALSITASQISDRSTALVTSLTGTPNRVTVSGANGAITLNGPQDLHTAASPTFAGLTLIGNAILSSAGTTSLFLKADNAYAWNIQATTGSADLKIIRGTDTYGSIGWGNGTFTWYNQTATTGSTSLVVRAGAGQSSNILFQLQDNSANVFMKAYASNGSVYFQAPGVASSEAYMLPGSGVFEFGGNTGVALKLTANAQERLRLNATGIGFFGATPVAKQTAPTAANASALNTGDATSDAVIGNMRTRLGEVITALQNLGLLN